MEHAAGLRVSWYSPAIKIEKSYKLEWCEDELRALLEKLIEGNYHTTAEFIYDHVANSGVEMKINPELEGRESMQDFLSKE